MNAKNQWWGYRHVDGSFHVKRYFGPEDLIEARQSPFVKQAHGPWWVRDRNSAMENLKREVFGKSEMNFEKALEMAKSAKINLKNMVKMMPALKQHPLLPVVEEQIKSCIEELEKE